MTPASSRRTAIVETTRRPDMNRWIVPTGGRGADRARSTDFQIARSPDRQIEDRQITKSPDRQIAVQCFHPMSVDLQIYERRERAMVRLADAALTPLGWRRPPQPQGPVRRVLLMRLERIGDLLMVVDAIQDARAAWPDAELDLAIGSWNAELAELLPGITRLEILDAPWLARERAGDPWPRLVRKARAWRRLEYDLAVNFEPDIRSNFLAWLSGAPARFGYSSAGGGRFLTHAEPYEPSRHVSDNARRLIARAAGRDPASPGTPRRSPALALPDAARRLGSAVLAGAARPIVAVHASGGRESKQWHVDRFAGVAQAVVAR